MSIFKDMTEAVRVVIRHYTILNSAHT